MLHSTKDPAERAFSIAWKKYNVVEVFNETLKELVQTQFKKIRKERKMSYERVKFRKPVAKKAGGAMRVHTEYNRSENKRVIEEELRETDQDESLALDEALDEEDLEDEKWIETIMNEGWKYGYV